MNDPQNPFPNPYGGPSAQPQAPYPQQPIPNAAPFSQPSAQPVPPVMDTTALPQKPDEAQKKNRARGRFFYVLVAIDICFLILLVYEIIDLFLS